MQLVFSAHEEESGWVGGWVTSTIEVGFTLAVALMHPCPPAWRVGRRKDSEPAKTRRKEEEEESTSFLPLPTGSRWVVLKRRRRWIEWVE